MVNSFMDWGCCLKKRKKHQEVLEAINAANAVDNYSFMKTSTVKQTGKRLPLRWSAAATVMLHQSINSNFKLLV
jgi:hypothetical protein